MEKCDPDIFEHGASIAMIAGPSARIIEEWVQHAAATCGVRMDWSFFAGRAIVKFLGGDGEEVKKAIRGGLSWARDQYHAEQKGDRFDVQLRFLEPYEDPPTEEEKRGRALMDKWKEEEEVRRLARVVETRYLVEGGSHSLWCAWSRQAYRMGHRCGYDGEETIRIEWEQIGTGFWETIGHLDNRPVCVTVHWNRLGPRRTLVGFWEATSKVVDYDMVESWLKQTFPNVKMTRDANNFHHIVEEVR